MNEEQDELFGQFIAEFAVENDLKLHDDDIIKAIELSDEFSHRWQKDLDFDETDDEIIKMVSVVWERIYTN